MGGDNGRAGADGGRRQSVAGTGGQPLPFKSNLPTLQVTEGRVCKKNSMRSSELHIVKNRFLKRTIL